MLFARVSNSERWRKERKKKRSVSKCHFEFIDFFCKAKLQAASMKVQNKLHRMHSESSPAEPHSYGDRALIASSVE